MNEIYRLTLTHYMAAGDEHISLEDPLVVQMVFDRSYYAVPVCINRMIDMMREEILKRAGETE